MESINHSATHITIKPCTLADISLMVEVGQKAYTDHYSHVWKNETDFYIKRSFSEAVFTKELEKESVAYYLLYYHQIPAGICKVNFNKGPDGTPDANAMELEKIYIQKKYAGKQIGQQTLHYLIKLAGSRQITTFWLSVMTTSRALDFYKKQGFTPVNYWYLDFAELKDEYRKMVTMVLEV